MDQLTLFDDDTGVSPVIGVILMVAITVLLAATAATFFLGFQDEANQVQPSAAFGIEYDADALASGSDRVTVGHKSGDTITAKELSVVVTGAEAGGGVDPNGRYQFENLQPRFGPSSSISAGTSVVLNADTMDGVPSGTVLEFKGATVKVIWTGGNDRSNTMVERTF